MKVERPEIVSLVLEMEEMWQRLKLFPVAAGVALLAALSMGEEFRVDEGDPSASVSISYQDGRYEVRNAYGNQRGWGDFLYRSMLKNGPRVW